MGMPSGILQPPGLWQQQHLSRVGQTALDGSGNASMIFQVGGYEIWDVQSATLTTNQALSSVKVPQAYFYRNIAIPQNQQSASYNGVINTFRGSVKLWTGEWLTVTLIGGVPAAVVTVTIEGVIMKRVG